MNDAKNEAKKMPGYVAGMSEDELRKKYNVTEIIKIGSNENPIGPSPHAVEAMQNAVANLHRYPPMADDGLREAISGALGKGVTPDHLITGNGGCDVLSMIADAFLDDDGECVICRPTFPVYEFLAKRNGAEVVFADLAEEDYTYNTETIIKAMSNRTQVVFLCSPNNPTGTLLPDADFQKIVDELPKGAVIVFDEVYYHFVTADNRPKALEATMAGKPIVVTHSFSKAYGLAGCRLGYGVAPPEIAQTIRGYRLPFHLNNMTTVAGIAALEDSEHLDSTVSTVIDGRETMFNGLKELGVEVWPSQGNFVLFRTRFNAATVSEELQKRGIILRPMSTFYLPDHLRVSIGRESDVNNFLKALSEIMSLLAAE